MKVTKDNWYKLFYSPPEIFLDGARMEHVVEADDVNRYVIIQLYDDGKPKHDGKIFLTERLEGAVVFVGRRIGE